MSLKIMVAFKRQFKYNCKRIKFNKNGDIMACLDTHNNIEFWRFNPINPFPYAFFNILSEKIKSEDYCFLNASSLFATVSL